MATFKRGWLRRGRIYSSEGFSVGIEDRTHMVYRSRGRKLTIAGELLANGGFAGSLVSTTTWDDGKPIEPTDQHQITSNIKQAFASQGQIVDFG